MARDYIVRRTADSDFWDEARATDYLARTVHEDHELIDIGVLDANGEKIMARQKPDPVGFIRWWNA